MKNMLKCLLGLKLMIPRIKKTIRKTEKQLSRKKSKVTDYKRRRITSSLTFNHIFLFL